MRLTSSSLSKEAKKIKKELGIKHSHALNMVAQDNGFANWQEFKQTEDLVKRFSIFNDLDIAAMIHICEKHDCFEFLDILYAVYSWNNDCLSDQVILDLLDIADFLVKRKQFVFAKYIYLRLVGINNSQGLYHLATMYDQGFGFKVNFDEALKYYQKSANLGNSYALLEIAKMQLFGGLEKNIEAALNQIKPLVAQKFSPAEVVLGYLYHVGLDGYVTVDKNKAEQLYLSAASQNNKDALYNLYCLYKDTEKHSVAMEYLQSSAKLGLERAQAEMVYYHINNKDIKSAEEIVYDTENYFHGIPQSILGEYYLNNWECLKARQLLAHARDVNKNDVARKLLKRYLPTEPTVEHIYITG